MTSIFSEKLGMREILFGSATEKYAYAYFLLPRVTDKLVSGFGVSVSAGVSLMVDISVYWCMDVSNRQRKKEAIKLKFVVTGLWRKKIF